MIENKNIILIGFMGAGKSHVGCLLADRLSVPFIDIDNEIAEKENMSINELFRARGEEEFRKIENRLIKRTESRKNSVIACGGGAVLDSRNIDSLRKNGLFVYLKAGEEEILKRMTGLSDRPLLNVDDRLGEIKRLLGKREPRYQEIADIIIDTSGLSPEEVTKEVMAAIGKTRDQDKE